MQHPSSLSNNSRILCPSNNHLQNWDRSIFSTCTNQRKSGRRLEYQVRSNQRLRWEPFQSKISNESQSGENLRSGPWLFENELVVMEKCHSWPLPESYKLESCDFWIQIYNIPWDVLKEEIITYVAKGLGRMTSINRRGAQKWSNFARVKISIDITKPLTNHLVLPLLDGTNHQVQVLYEKLPR